MFRNIKFLKIELGYHKKIWKLIAYSYIRNAPFHTLVALHGVKDTKKQNISLMGL